MKLEDIVKKTISKQIAKMIDVQNLDEKQIHEFIATSLKEVATDGIKRVSSALTDTLREQIPDRVTYERSQQEEFERRLYERWKKPLDLYDAIVNMTMEFGESFVKQYAAQAEKDKDNVFGALMSIHVKACQTALAIGALLKNGFARDALARQRTLHEFACTAIFIKKHGQETAERYWLHHTIESYKAAWQYEQHYQKLGYEPQDPAKFAALRSRRDALIARFGITFNKSYGWAAQALDRNGVTFADIEKDVQLDHFRPYYQMASDGVHANSKGLIVDVGHPYLDLAGYRPTIFAGASNAGLADPGQSALNSLNQCTIIFLTLKNDLETMMKLQALHSFVGEAYQAFIEIHRELEVEEIERIKAMQSQD